MEPVVAELRAKKKCSFSTLVPSPMIANPGYLRSSWCTRGFRSEMSATVSGTPRSMWGPFWWGGSSTASWRPSSPRGCLSPSQGRLIGPWGTLEDSWPPPAPGNFAQPPAHFCLKWKFRNSAQSPSGSSAAIVGSEIFPPPIGEIARSTCQWQIFASTLLPFLRFAYVTYYAGYSLSAAAGLKSSILRAKSNVRRGKPSHRQRAARNKRHLQPLTGRHGFLQYFSQLDIHFVHRLEIFTNNKLFDLVLGYFPRL